MIDDSSGARSWWTPPSGSQMLHHATARTVVASSCAASTAAGTASTSTHTCRGHHPSHHRDLHEHGFGRRLFLPRARGADGRRGDQPVQNCVLRFNPIIRHVEHASPADTAAIAALEPLPDVPDLRSRRADAAPRRGRPASPGGPHVGRTRARRESGAKVPASTTATADTFVVCAWRRRSSPWRVAGEGAPSGAHEPHEGERGVGATTSRTRRWPRWGRRLRRSARRALSEGGCVGLEFNGAGCADKCAAPRPTAGSPCSPPPNHYASARYTIVDGDRT